MLADSQQEIGIHYWEVGKLSSSYCSQICACNTSNGIPFINRASGDPCLLVRNKLLGKGLHMVSRLVFQAGWGMYSCWHCGGGRVRNKWGAL